MLENFEISNSYSGVATDLSLHPSYALYIGNTNVPKDHSAQKPLIIIYQLTGRYITDVSNLPRF